MRAIYLYITIIFLLISSAISAIDYKEYKAETKYKDYFQIQYSRNSDKIQFNGMDDKNVPVMVTFSRSDINISAGIVSVNNHVLIDKSNIYIQDEVYPIDNIADCFIRESDNEITLAFKTAKDSSQLARFKRGNRMAYDSELVVTTDDFVRGMVLNILGNIKIDGEVNKNIISLFGDITILDHGVVREDLASITGNIKFEDKSIVYGAVYDKQKKGRALKHRIYRDQSEFEFDPYFSYDRVDGAAFSFKVSHQDIDSILPTMEAEIGIGFASDRGRYKFLLEQTIFREHAIIAGGTFYRELSTDDDWLIEKNENTFFALLAKEDYRDYYETEGGSLYLKAVPSSHITLESGYSFYTSNWLPSNRHLWGLFRGSDALFDLNYNSWDMSQRDAAIVETDTSDIGSLYGMFHYYSDSTKSETDHSNWHITADIEISNKSLNSDFDYHRYILTARRLQKINDQSIFTVRTIFGNSDGYLPMFRRFYLGGLGSLHGYNHKEYIGTRFWMMNTEYRIDFPHSEFGVSAFWDMGQIANDTKLNSDIEIKQSIGLSIFFEDDFTLSVAKRLDRSTNDSPKLYLRFNQTF